MMCNFASRQLIPKLQR